MKTTTKIAFAIGLGSITLAIAYFLIPRKEWKQYKENHPSLFEVQDENTPTYNDFCKSFWKTFGKINTEKEQDITFDGGELPEYTVTP